MLRAIALMFIMLGVPARAYAQIEQGCTAEVSDRMMETVNTTRSFLRVLEFSRLSAENYPDELHAEVGQLTAQQEAIAAQLSEMVTRSEDLAYKIRLCSRK